MERYRIEVGKFHKTKPANIVGAIINEAGIDGDFIGKIKIYDDYSTVDLPAGMPQEILQNLKKVRISGQKLDITKMTESVKSRKKRNQKSKKKKKK